jgi:hypothetical protein
LNVSHHSQQTDHRQNGEATFFQRLLRGHCDPLRQ